RIGLTGTGEYGQGQLETFGNFDDIILPSIDEGIYYFCHLFNFDSGLVSKPARALAIEHTTSSCTASRCLLPEGCPPQPSNLNLLLLVKDAL
ncbi:hypothetical protein NEUTE2DRAFT_84308, partial [Neurospora tetrasperma FGSC 2509]